MSITSALSHNVSVFGYQINVGQGLTTAVALGVVTAYFLKKIYFCSEQSKPLLLSDTVFWEKIEKFATLTNDSDPVVIGDSTYSNRSEAQKEMALSCNRISDYVKKYLIQSNFKGTVLDLGCGTGANAIPLVAKGCRVTIIDKEKAAIMAYNGNEMNLFFANFSKLNSLQQARSIVGDITEQAYPENIDAVICIDTLPYVSPSKLKATLDKIFQALRPGGQFVGTIFFKPKQGNSILTEVMSQLGACFYPKDFAREIIIRSGFQIKKETERRDGRFTSHCLEFLAEKPA